MDAGTGDPVGVRGKGIVACEAVADCVGAAVAAVAAGAASVPYEATPPCPRQAPLRRALE